MLWYLLIIAVLFALFPRKFLFVVRVGYCLELYLFYCVFIRMWTVNEIPVLWGHHSVWFLGINLKKSSHSVPVVKSRSVMLIGNHRNFCDFLLHDTITENTSSYLSRAMVGFIFPAFGIMSLYYNTVWYFVRGNLKDFDQFFSWLDGKFGNAFGRLNLLVYPEGHRNLKKEPLELKTGMIRYAFSRNMPVQMFMCGGYDEVINEKKFSSKWERCDVNYRVYEPIHPNSYSSFEVFMNEIREQFVQRFKEIHGMS